MLVHLSFLFLIPWNSVLTERQIDRKDVYTRQSLNIRVYLSHVNVPMCTCEYLCLYIHTDMYAIYTCVTADISALSQWRQLVTDSLTQDRLL